MSRGTTFREVVERHNVIAVPAGEEAWSVNCEKAPMDGCGSWKTWELFLCSLVDQSSLSFASEALLKWYRQVVLTHLHLYWVPQSTCAGLKIGEVRGRCRCPLSVTRWSARLASVSGAGTLVGGMMAMMPLAAAAAMLVPALWVLVVGNGRSFGA